MTTDQTAAVEVQEAPETDAAESLVKGYESVANPEKAREAQAEQIVKEAEVIADNPTAEEPPVTNEQIKDLMSQVSRIPELEKQLRDSGGRYGALKQSLEQLQQRITTATTDAQVKENSVDASELLTDLREDYPELAEKLQGAFSKLAATRQGEINPESIRQILAAEREAERAEREKHEVEELTTAHPDWQQVIQSREFNEWKSTLNPREQARISRSRDPNYAADMLDKHKDWLTSRTKQTTQEVTKPAVNKRLAGAVIPTNGTKQAPTSEPSASEALMRGYKRVAGARI